MVFSFVSDNTFCNYGLFIWMMKRFEIVGLTQEKSTCESKCFFQRNKSLAGFVKCTSCVKYASRVKCAAAREGIYFISHRTK